MANTLPSAASIAARVKKAQARTNRAFAAAQKPGVTPDDMKELKAALDEGVAAANELKEYWERETARLNLQR